MRSPEIVGYALVGAVALMLVAGCAGIKQESFVLSSGQTVDYVHGKVDADGQTGVFRDAYIDGVPVISHYGAGQSLIGQILQGSGPAAVFGGALLGSAALVRPDRHVDTTVVDQEFDKAALQSTVETPLIQEPLPEAQPITIINSNSNSNRNTSRSSSRSRSSAKSTAHSNVKMGDITGGSGGGGGVPGCQKAKFGC